MAIWPRRLFRSPFPSTSSAARCSAVTASCSSGWPAASAWAFSCSNSESSSMKRWPLFPLEARHEARLILAANPALFGLLTLGRVAGRVRKVPRVGWLITDPLVARRLLGDSEHTSLLGEGGVGHLWAQILGDWVNESFDGPGHATLRRQARDLFTDVNAQRHVTRVFAEPAARLAEALRRNETIDIAETARVWVGRMVADLLGLSIAKNSDDASYRSIF